MNVLSHVPLVRITGDFVCRHLTAWPLNEKVAVQLFSSNWWPFCIFLALVNGLSQEPLVQIYM